MTQHQQHDLSLMSWKQVEAAVSDGPAVLIPIGTSEAQGPHNPVAADYLLAHAFAKRVAENSGSFYLAGIPYGNSVAFRGFPGAFWLRPTTLESLLLDLSRSLMHHGFERLVVGNNHGPNEPSIESALRMLRDETGLIVPVLLPAALAREWTGEMFPAESLGHGSEPMTSLMSYLFPQAGSAEIPLADQYQSWHGMDPESSSRVRFEGQPVGLYLNVHEYSKSAFRGAPQASPELGRQLMERLVDFGVRFVKHFRNLDPRIGSE